MRPTLVVCLWNVVPKGRDEEEKEEEKPEFSHYDPMSVGLRVSASVY